jgi:hypothetical protein
MTNLFYDQKAWEVVALELMMKKVRILIEVPTFTEGWVNDTMADGINFRTINVQLDDLSLVRLKSGEYSLLPQ